MDGWMDRKRYIGREREGEKERERERKRDIPGLCAEWKDGWMDRRMSKVFSFKSIRKS
jgi:hypothetical protein